MKNAKQIIFEGVFIKVDTFTSLVRFSFGEKDTFGVIVTRDHEIAWHVYARNGMKLASNSPPAFDEDAQEDQAFCAWALGILKANKSEHERLRSHGFQIRNLRSLDDRWEPSSFDPI